tara:strand:+ start:2513 stop:2839 length:327 start_codon:yes stop_codon:yes gene_type:complete
MVEITFNNTLNNPSLQVKDKAYYTTPNTNGFSTAPELIGEITSIVGNKITILNNISSPSINDFIMFSKNTIVNNSSLLGYYAEVKLTNSRTDKIELFSIGAEVVESSK